MIDIYLNIFPQGSLDSSVITTVWVGMFVFAFFNLRFGWSLSGLIVPGYLVPLFLVRPWSAAVVIVEAVLCYFLVLWLFEYAPRLGIWNSVFGRDRFFALLLVSVIVRLFLDGWFLPHIGEMVNDRFAINFDYQNNLYSFGLIIVALIANQFWKPGFFRGMIPFSITVGTTYLIVRYVLMEWTNFSISNLGYMYEDIASSMLTSPKAYIILLTTAYIASQINLHYGWEYNGILVPSLIALLWYQPFKIVASFVETFAILGTAALILRLPVFKKTTIEGARKILLFFNISYAYKFLLAYLILWYMPEKKISDYYGFGYLLPCLLAIKMFDKDIIVRMTRATIQTSFMAIMLASAVGFSLTLLPNLSAERYPSGDELEFERVSVSEKRLIDVIREEKIGMYQHRLKNRSRGPLPGDIEIFSEAIRKLLRYAERRDPQLLAQAQWLLAKVHYRIKEVDERYMYLYESELNRGWGLYAIDLNSSKQFVVEVPAPFTEWGTMEAGTWLFTMMEGKALAIAGSTAQKTGSGGSRHILNSPNSFFYAFHKEVALRDVVQVRGYTAQNTHALSHLRREAPEGGVPELESTLWVKSSLPPGLHLAKLEELIGDFTIEWGRTPLKNVQRETTGSGFAELYLNSSDMRKLFFTPLLAEHDAHVQMNERKIKGNLQEWLFAQKEKTAPKGSQGYIKPKLEELMFFDQEILVPLLNMAHIEHSSEQWSQASLEQLRTIAAAAAVMGYEIVHFRQNMSTQEYLILVEQEQLSNPRHWGTYVIRVGQAHRYAIQIPRPVFETHVFEYGVSLFESLQARVLLVSGSHKDANVDGSADVLRGENIQNLFNLVNQVTLRESGDEPMMVLQARALGAHEDQPLPNVDAVLAFHSGVQNAETLSPLGHQLFDTLQADGISLQFADGSPETAGYEAGKTVQSLYLNETRRKEFAILWLSPALRAHYSRQTTWWHEVQCQTLGIPTETSYLQSHLLENAVWETSEKVPQRLYKQLTHYISTHDIVALQAMIDRWDEYRFERVIDMSSGQAFLLVYSSRSKLMLVSNLFPRNVNSSYSISGKANVEDTISRFLHTRSAWLKYKPQ